MSADAVYPTTHGWRRVANVIALLAVFLSMVPAAGLGFLTGTAYAASTGGTGPGGVGAADGSSSLALWLRADQGVYSDAGCSVDASSSDLVNCWADQSGSGHHALDNSAPAVGSPSYQTDVLNSYQPALRFGGAQGLSTAAMRLFDTTSSPLTIFTVYNTNNNAGQKWILNQGNQQCVNSLELGYGQTGAGSVNLHMGCGAAASTAAGTIANGSFEIMGTHILATGTPPANTQFYKNGALLGVSGGWTSPGNYSTALKPVDIGVRNDYGSGNYNNFHLGDIAEVIVFKSSLSQLERILVQNYLSAKFGIALSADDIYAGDDAGNGNYDFDVAGIGRLGASMNAEAHAAGLVLSSATFLADSGDAVVVGRGLGGPNETVSDLPGDTIWSGGKRWSRSWFVDVTDGAGQTGGTVSLAFDLSEYGLGGAPSGSAGRYHLLARTGPSGQFTDLGSATSIAGDQVSFNGVNVGLLEGQNVTLGFVNELAVTTTDDELNVDGDCSLREAIETANTDLGVDACPTAAGTDTIFLPAGTYTLSIAGAGENANATGDLDITEALTINGAGAATTTIDGNTIDRVFHSTGGTLTLNDLTIRNGRATGSSGGGILASGDLSLTRVVARQNQAGDGGGVYTSNILTMVDSEMRNNVSTSHGGGAYALNGANIQGGIFENNSASGYGGGVQIAGGGIQVSRASFINNTGGVGGGISYYNTAVGGQVTNTLFERNTSPKGNAILVQYASNLQIRHVTIASPTLTSGAGIFLDAGSNNVQVTNTIIANQATGIQRAAGAVTENYNLFYNNTTNLVGTITSGGNSSTGNPAFVNAADGNYHLTINSPAVDAGTNLGVAVDVDGDVRPQSLGFDIGFDELNGIGIGNATVTEGNSGTTNASFTVSVGFARAVPVSVDYATYAGSATAGSDYTAIPTTTLTFAPGEINKTVVVAVSGDTDAEPNETFSVRLGNPSGVTIGDGVGAGRILSDEGPIVVNTVDDELNADGDCSLREAISTASTNALVDDCVTGRAAGTDTIAFAIGSGAKSIPLSADLTINSSVNLDGTTQPGYAGIPLISIGAAYNGTVLTLSGANNSTVTGLDLSWSGTGSAGMALSSNNSQNVTIANNIVRRRNTGIWVVGGYDARVQNNDMRGTGGSNWALYLSGVTSSVIPGGVQVAGNQFGTWSGQTSTYGVALVNLVSGLTISDGSLPGAHVVIEDTSGLTQTVSTALYLGTLTNTTVDNLDLSYGGNDTSGNGLSINSTQNITVTNTIVHKRVGGITITGGRDARVLNNDVRGSGTGGGGAYGIYLTGLTGSVIPGGVQVAGNQFGTWAGQQSQWGLFMQNLPSGLKVSDGSLSGSHIVLADNNGMSEVSTLPVAILSVANMTIDKLDLSWSGAGTSGVGLHLDSTANATLSNFVSLKRTTGINWLNGNGLDASCLDLRNNGTGVSSTGTGVTISQSRIQGNTTRGVNNDNAGLLMAENNYWGGAPSTQGNVDATPQLLGVPTCIAMPAISIANGSVAEGTSGTGTLNVPVTLSFASGGTVTVDYTVDAGTATAGEDYTASNGTLTFAPGETTKSVSVSVSGDVTYEPNETVSVTLANPTGAALANSSATGTITNDDAAPTLSVDDQSVSEGNSGIKTVTFTVSLSGPSYQAITVDYATADDSAASPGDYAAATGSLTFAPGETSKTIVVTVNGDALSEANETFTVGLSNPANATIADATGLGTIANDDTAVSIGVDDQSVTEGDDGTQTVTFNVTLSAVSGQEVTVAYATAPGSATTPADYATASGTLTFAPGETSKTVAVTVKGDTLDEVDETFAVALSAPTGATLADASGTGTIADDDAEPELTLNDDTQRAEGNIGNTTFVFTATLSAPSGKTVTVDYATIGGDATVGSDYIAVSGTLTFAPGETEQTFVVLVKGDTLDEYTYQFVNIALSNAVNTTLGSGGSQAVIVDDDPSPAISIADLTVTEGDADSQLVTFTVTLSAPSENTITVDYATADDSAKEPGDYAAASGTLTFNPGETAKSITVEVAGDALHENDETFAVALSNATNASLGDDNGVGTIANDDGAPTISIADSGEFEGASNTTVVRLRVTLSAASALPVSVAYATADNTAVSPADYTAASGTLTFAPGETEQTVEVSIKGDITFEPDETFTVALSGPSGATIADGTGVATIANDDGQPSVSVADVSVTEGNSGTTSASFAVTLSNPSYQTVSVGYSTEDGNTTAGVDYTSAGGTITFAPGETSKTVTILVKGDTLDEVDELFGFVLGSPANATFGNNGTGTILDDDAAPVLSINADNCFACLEGNSGTTARTFTVSLSAPSGKTVNVDYATEDGNAVAPADYTAKSGTLTFAPGETSKTITVLANGDATFEPDEYFAVALSNAGNATIAAFPDDIAAGFVDNDDAAPTLAVSDVAVAEGAGSASFDVTLSGPSYQTITVNYATADGSAKAPGDYTSKSGTLTFAPGETSKSVAVTIGDDPIDEAGETFLLNLSAPANATIGAGQGQGSIADNDDAPTVDVVAEVSADEGDSGSTSLPITVTLSHPSAFVVSVSFNTDELGEALAGEDYTTTSTTVTFAPGETSKTVSVPVLGDTTYENDGFFETFGYEISSPTNATLGAFYGLADIYDDDAVPAIALGDVTVVEGDSGTRGATFQVTLTNARDEDVEVTFATANGSAVAADDYSGIPPSTLTIGAGQTSKTITVQVVGDVRYENDETFSVNLSAPVNATIADASGTGTITNDDPQPAISIADVAVDEGTGGPTPASMAVTLSNPSAFPVTVDFATANGSATAPADYAAISGTLTFDPGQTSKLVLVNVSGDPLDEANETFTVGLSNPTNATIADASATATIGDDDLPPAVSIGNLSRFEGTSGPANAVFPVTLSAPSGLPVTVDFATVDGTALAGADYTAASGTITFNPGETAKSVTVVILHDTLDEEDETYQVALSNPSMAVLGTNPGNGTIRDNDQPPGAAATLFSAPAYPEGPGGTHPYSFTVALSAPSGRALTVDFTTVDGTALAGEDYLPISGTLTFLPGQTSKPVVVLVKGDPLWENDETFYLQLTGGSNVAPDAGLVGAPIQNDDPVPDLAIADGSVVEGDSGPATGILTVTLSNPSAYSVTVGYATSDRTASAPLDYTAKSGTLTFLPGETSKPIAVDVKGDVLDEADEQLAITLSNVYTTTMGIANVVDASGELTIADDDGSPELRISDAGVVEGDDGLTTMSFTVTLSAPSGQPVSFSYATSDGTATAGEDYVPDSGSFGFAPGQVKKVINIDVLGDTTYESDGSAETLMVTLDEVANATVADGSGTGSIANDDDAPALSIADSQVTEGDDGTTAASFAITLSNPRDEEVTVDYATASGTATAGADFTAASGTLTFAPGETSKTVTVDVLGDLLDEHDEGYSVELSSPVNASVDDASGAGGIVDDDATPTLSIADKSVAEGASGTAATSFAVTLSAASGLPVTVQYATADGTATAGEDYTAKSGTLTFAPGETSVTVTVDVSGDTTYEGDETFTVTLSSPSNASLADGDATGTIANDDAQPALSIGDKSVSEGNSGTTSASFAVTLSNPSAQTIAVQYATADGTATAGEDYTAASGTLTFAPGETSKTVTVDVLGDALDEASEGYTVTLSSPTNATIADGSGAGTILNDDATALLNIGDAEVTEGDSGTTSASFTVTLDTQSGLAVTVAYATVAGSATSGVDYTAASGTLTFAPGETSKTITVDVLGDLRDENDEGYSVELSSPVNAGITDNSGAGSILDDDAAPTVSVDDESVAEGDSGATAASFAITLSAASGLPVSVQYATASGTATSDVDFTAASGTVTFAPGETSKTITVDVLGDLLDEENEGYTVVLSSPSNATLGDSSGAGSITDDDATPTLSIADASMTEGTSGNAGSASFAVTLSAASGLSVTVQYATADGTATAGTDYTAASGTLTFAPGETSKTVSVQARVDNIFEGDETFAVTLGSPSNAALADGSATVTILDDDAQPAISIGDASVTEGNSGTASTSFTIALSNPSAQTVTVAYATADETATAGVDYTAASGTVTFAPGETSKTVTVSVSGDTMFESDELFTVGLSTPSAATIADGSGAGTIANDDSTPGIIIGDDRMIEGNSGTTTASFTIALTNPSASTITVDYATASGTATTGADFTAASGTLTFAPGETSKTVTVDVLADLLDELDETFAVTLSNPSNGLVGDGSGAGTIDDDDDAPVIGIGDATIAEGNSGTKLAQLVVSLSAPSGQTVGVSYNLGAGGTALNNSDFTIVTGTLTFAPGETSKTVDITVVGEALLERDETVNVQLASPQNATLALDTVGTLTIVNDDGPAIKISDVAKLEGNSGTTTFVFNVTLSATPRRDVRINFVTANGTAVAGKDYAAKTGAVTFLAGGTTTKTIVVNVTGDLSDEPNETFFVRLSSPINAHLLDGEGRGTILADGDPRPKLTIPNLTVAEGTGGQTLANVRVVLAPASGKTVTVKVVTATGGTATAGTDYTTTSQIVTFAPGETVKIVQVPIAADALDEANETVRMRLTTPTNAVVPTTPSTLTIRDDDGPAISVADRTVTETNAGTTTTLSFVVTLSAPSPQSVTVRYATANGTARAGSTLDYLAKTGTLTFAAGQTRQTVSVVIQGDNLDEVNETFLFNLTAPVNATIADGQAVGTIVDND